jgi:transposase
LSSRECPTCGGTLYLSEVDHTLKVETWECAELECDFSEDTHSPPSR